MTHRNHFLIKLIDPYINHHYSAYPVRCEEGDEIKGHFINRRIPETGKGKY